ncbi:hypothetical protein TREPR_2648 [Treponema primitia ZAS-2]|uniref:Outer membrane protein beta-barrel domain-containing protein n=1 Tax=Treponema primitia (strain ATCC BAA-887 / DSM 12427 / ZAS-2) TaxID=545694 RepID=F5YR85_TREPZ|nr:outer membrane beta-barrel protein [Treponema primitia]AEF85580.1 hypothetical protein TREPR_2648 [Treponema primitia ZAS-2]
MKKFLSAIFLCSVISGVSIFAFEAEDLKTYPDVTPAGSFAINGGIGINALGSKYGELTVPPLSVSADYALPLGGLPFFVGGIFGFYASRDSWKEWTTSYEYTGLFFDIGARFGYHFNWTVPNLDTYAVATLGVGIESSNLKIAGKNHPDTDPAVLFGVAIGGRYFFTPNLGAFLELGYSSLSIVTLGVSFKF